MKQAHPIFRELVEEHSKALRVEAANPEFLLKPEEPLEDATLRGIRSNLFVWARLLDNSEVVGIVLFV